MVGKTDKNLHSSRSHLLVTFLLVRENAIFSKLCLVDLAGSENLQNTDCNGVRKAESTKIQASLMYLKNLLEDLAKGRPSTHKREGKLNTLLKVGNGGKFNL